MKVSVCIPTYNSASYVRECIESVLAQTLTDFEIVVCDNHSGDNTWDIVLSFSDPRVRCYRADRNLGMVHNFSFTVGLAQGSYVKLLCSDDLLDRRALEMQSKFLDKNMEVVLVTCACRIMDERGRLCRIHKPLPYDSVLRPTEVMAISLLRTNFIGAPSAVMFRRQSFLRVGPFSEHLPRAIDWDMWLRMAEVSSTGYLAAPLCTTREHGNSFTSELRRIGGVHKDTLIVMKRILRHVKAGKVVRWISCGRMAGSFLRQAIYGLQRGQLRCLLSELGRAFRIDPGFLGLIAYLVLFRSGILGLHDNRRGGVKVAFGARSCGYRGT